MQARRLLPIARPALLAGLLLLAVLVSGAQAGGSLPGPAKASALVGPAAALQADLTISKTASPDPVQVGGRITYTVTVRWVGGSVGASNVFGADRPPPELTFVSATPSQGSPCTFNGGLVQCQLGNIDRGGQATITIVFTVNARPASGSITNLCSVFSGNDPNEANNHCEVKTPVASAVAPQCSDGKDNDRDGKIDHPADSGCSSASDNDERNVFPPGKTECSDRKDNDADKKTDFPNDPDCESRKDDSEACLPEAALNDVDAMENLVRRLTKDVKDGKLSEKQLDRRQEAIADIKLDMLDDHFTNIFGIEFRKLFRVLESLDFNLFESANVTEGDDEHLRHLAAASKRLTELRGLLKTGRAVPGPLSADLDAMESLLNRLTKDVNDGKLSEKQLDRRQEAIADIKLDMLDDHFPSICGIEFEKLFRVLESLDFNLFESANVTEGDDEHLRHLNAAAKRVVELRALLKKAK